MEYPYNILSAIALLVITIMVIIFFRKRKPSTAILVRSSGTYIEKQGEEGFISFMYDCAKKENISSDSAYDYFVKNFESLRLSYVYQTGSSLFLNDISKTVEKAVKAMALNSSQQKPPQ